MNPAGRTPFVVAALVLGACSYDWDALDPREGAGPVAGGASSISGAAGVPGTTGAAGHVTGGQAGTAGQAGETSTGSCDTAEEFCGGECVSTQTSLDHCGWCDHQCQRYAICLEGACANPCDASGLEALLVVADAANVGAGDRVVTHLLEALGFAVVAVSTDATAADAEGMDLVLISSTAQSNTVGTNFTDVDVPLICWDAHLFDDLGLTGATAQTDFDTMIQQRDAVIADAAHPLAVGLSESVPLYSQPSDMAWGVPTEDAVVIATAESNPEWAVLFALDAGDQLMSGDPAPARRMGLFLGDASAPSLSDDGERLALASFCWAARLYP